MLILIRISYLGCSQDFAANSIDYLEPDISIRFLGSQNRGRSNASAIPSAPARLLELTFEALSNKEDMRNPDPTGCLLCERNRRIRNS